LKKLRAYLHYFFYLGWNWNFRLASIILFHEIRGEKKYHINSTGIDDLTRSISDEDLRHASIYQPINYFIAEWLFNQLDKEEIANNAFLDAGCGRGRVMAMAAWYGLKKIYGIDISPVLCHEAIHNMDIISPIYPSSSFTVICADARITDISQDIGIIFMFNPFTATIMQPFLEKVIESIQQRPRKITILYANPECKEILIEMGFRQTATIQKLTWLQGSVFIFESKLLN
jgi:SAM-dependent methyltransferase